MEMVKLNKNEAECAVDTIAQKESDNSIESETDVKNHTEKDLNNHSLLTLLDDKNRSISLLKRQIHNQKLQLEFYLHRVFNSRKVIQLSESCTPQETEENIHLNLAMSKFCKQTGLKSRIMGLHGRMINLEKRVTRMTIQQEDMVREIVTKLLEFAKKGMADQDNDVMSFLMQLNSDTGQVESLAKIVQGTTRIRKDLDVFRTCCNRLIAIEDERNSLVEQVYSMPVAQRVSYGVLLATQYEKIRLEREVQEIKQEQMILQQRFMQMSVPNTNITNNQSQVTTVDDQTDMKVQKMLEAVNCEAVKLLSLAKDQKQKYLHEIQQLKDKNSTLSEQMVTLKAAAQEKNDLEYKLQLAQTEIQRLKDADQNRSNELVTRLQSLSEENLYLQEKLKQYYNIEGQVQWLRTQVEDTETITSQRDYYKAQVEDLQAIRAAYAQLVEHCPAHGDEVNLKQQLEERIKELENQRDAMAQEIDTSNEILFHQESQIRNLLIIIDKLGTTKESREDSKKGKSYKGGKTHDSGYTTSDSRSAYSQTKSTEKKSKKSGPSECLGILQDKATTCTNLDDLDSTYENGGKYSSEESPRSSFIERDEEELCKVDSSLAPLFQSPIQSPPLSTTSVKIHSTNQEGKSESLKAVLESSSFVKGTIEVNSSSLSLRLSCGIANVNTNTKSEATEKLKKIENENECMKEHKDGLTASNDLEEAELMKDSSRETVVYTLPSVHRPLCNLLTSVKCFEYTQEIVNNEDDNATTSKASTRSVNSSDDDVNHDNESNSEGDEEKNVRSGSPATPSRKERECKSLGSIDPSKSHLSALSDRLKQLTSNIDNTLAQPGGRESLISAMKVMYQNTPGAKNIK